MPLRAIVVALWWRGVLVKRCRAVLSSQVYQPENVRVQRRNRGFVAAQQHYPGP